MRRTFHVNRHLEEGHLVVAFAWLNQMVAQNLDLAGEMHQPAPDKIVMPRKVDSFIVERCGKHVMEIPNCELGFELIAMTSRTV